MKSFVTKEFTFDAAHHLTKYYGKCEKPHGHTYKLQVTLRGEVSQNGLIVDFVILKRIVKKHVLDFLDHTDINNIIDNPSCENIAIWIFNKLKPIEKLLLDEIDDPNLDSDIKNYLQDPTSSLEKGNQSNGLQLEQIKLFETATSWVTIKNED